jgi:Arc/MetJ-type ribon-helix-helix transcriptional regulator
MYNKELSQYIKESLDSILEKMFSENSKTKKLREQSDYQAHFKSMLQKWNIKSPNELSEDKKKEFFNQLSSSWKKKKGGEE